MVDWLLPSPPNQKNPIGSFGVEQDGISQNGGPQKYLRHVDQKGD